MRLLDGAEHGVDRVLSKPQTIDAIIQINRSATKDFLDRFDTRSLKRYLDHLQLTQEPRGRCSVWIREGESRAIVTRQPMS